MNRQSNASELWHAPIRLTRAIMGTPDDNLLELINKISRRKLDAAEVFVLSGVPSTNARDSYFTYMHDSSLRRFVRNLNAGSAFLDSHDATRLPIGSSFYGQLENIPEGQAEGVAATKRIAALWYLVRNMNVPGSGNTEDYVRGVEAGIFSKLSIGFGGPDMRLICDIDGRDMWDWESPHYPGEILEDGTLVLYAVHDADLYETSAVYKNATPGAMLDRMQSLINDRKIPAADVVRLSRAVNHRFDVPAPRSYPTYPQNRPVADLDAREVFYEGNNPDWGDTGEDRPAPAIDFRGGKGIHVTRAELRRELAANGLALAYDDAPRVRPTSLPPLPDAEPLSWRAAGDTSRSYEPYDPFYSNLEDPDPDECAGLLIVGGPDFGGEDEDAIARQFREDGLRLTRG